MHSVINDYLEQPWAVRIGVECFAKGAQIELELPFASSNLNAEGGVIHGGIIATLLNDVARLQVDSICRDENNGLLPLFVNDSHISYLRPSSKGRLKAVGEILRRGKQFIFTTSRVEDEEGRCIASAHTVFMNSSTFKNPATDLKTIEPGADSYLEAQHTLTSMGQMMNQNLLHRLPGMEVVHLRAGHSLLLAEHRPHFSDNLGGWAPGAMLTVADNAGVFASFQVGDRMTRSSTVSIGLTYCAETGGEDLFATGESLSHNGPLVHNQIRLFGRQSKRLLAFGTLTFLC